MIRCIKTHFYSNSDTLNKLFECNRLSAQVYNDCLEHSKQYSLANSGKWINKSQLQALTKGQYELHSQSIQAVVHKYLFARDSAFQARKKGLKNKYPYKKKNNFNTKWTDKAFKINKNKIQLSMGRGRNSLYITVPIDLTLLDVKEIELIYDKTLKLSICYDNNEVIKENNNVNQVGVDLGEIHSISAYCDNGNALIII